MKRTSCVPSANSKQKTLQTPRNHHSLLPHRPLSPLPPLTRTHILSHLYLFVNSPPPMTLVCCTFGLVCPCACAALVFSTLLLPQCVAQPKNCMKTSSGLLYYVALAFTIESSRTTARGQIVERGQLITACWRGNKGNGLRWRTPIEVR